MLKTNSIRNKDSAGFSTKTQMAVYLPLFYYYLVEYLKHEQSQKNPLRTKLVKLEKRVRELVEEWHSNIDVAKIGELRPKLGRHLLKWKVDLLESEDCWVSWFTGITGQFLNQSNSNSKNKLRFCFWRLQTEWIRIWWWRKCRESLS